MISRRGIVEILAAINTLLTADGEELAINSR